MNKYPFSIAVTACSAEDAAARVELLQAWAVLPVKMELIPFCAAVFKSWAIRKMDQYTPLNSAKQPQVFNIELTMPGASQHQAKANFELMLQWAAFPLNLDWKELLRCAIRFIICRQMAL